MEWQQWNEYTHFNLSHIKMLSFFNQQQQNICQMFISEVKWRARVHRSLRCSCRKQKIHSFFMSILKYFTCAHCGRAHLQMKCLKNVLLLLGKYFMTKQLLFSMCLWATKTTKTSTTTNQPTKCESIHKHSLIRNDKGNEEKIKEKCWGKTESGIPNGHVSLSFYSFFLFFTRTHIQIFEQYFYIFKMKNEEENKNDKQAHSHSTYIHHKRHIMNVVKPYMCLYMQEQKKPKNKIK